MYGLSIRSIAVYAAAVMRVKKGFPQGGRLGDGGSKPPPYGAYTVPAIL